MKIGIHFDNNYDMNHAEMCENYLKRKNVEVKRLNLLAPNALEQVKECDGVIWRWEHNPDHKQSAQKVLFAIEKCLGIPVFPDSNTAWHYDEKIYQYYVLQALNSPVPDTWLFWDHSQAVNWLETVQFPVIFKLSCGAGSSNVLKIDSKKIGLSLINKLFSEGIFPYTMNEFKPNFRSKNIGDIGSVIKRYCDGFRYALTGEYPKLDSKHWKCEHNYVYFQEFLPDNNYDTRITIIGDSAFGFRRINRKNDFRASGSGNIDYSPEKIDLSMIDIAFNLSYNGKFQSMSYDFLYRKDEPVVCEISYTFSEKAVYDCPGHWSVEKMWIPGHIWPEEAQMDLFLKQIGDSHSYIKGK